MNVRLPIINEGYRGNFCSINVKSKFHKLEKEKCFTVLDANNVISVVNRSKS